jgi:DNA polymerase-3 subunit delta
VKRVAAGDALAQALARSLPSPIWVATDEPLLQVESGDLVRARARALGHVERVVIDVGTGFDASRLVGESRSQSLFGERRLLDLRLAGKLPRGFGEALAEVAIATRATGAGGTPADCAVLVTSPRLDKAATGSAWFGGAMADGLLVEGNAPEPAQFGRWIAQRLAANDQRADDASIALIAERTEGNLVAAQQAIDRLALLAPRGRVEAAIVDEAVTDNARFDPFGLVEAALSGQVGRTLAMVDALRAEDAPLPLLAWSLADALRRLLRAIDARESGQPVPSALRSAGVFGRREAAYRRALGTLTRDQAIDALRQVARLDRMAKGVDSSALAGDPWSMAERILVAIAGVRPLPESPSVSAT